MPAPQESLFSQQAKTFFTANGIQLPMDWQSPGEQFCDAFAASERSVSPNSPTNLFAQATLNKYHVDAAADIGKKFETFIDASISAICSAIDQWMKMTTIAGAVINGPSGMLMPGNVLGPPLAPLILAKAPQATAFELKYSVAIANAIGSAWQAWHAGLMGNLMYPSFAAFPGPMAPPTPNVPVPLLMFSSAGDAGLSASTLKSSMLANLGDPQALHAKELFDAICKAFELQLLTFKSTTMVQNVLGTGPIPTFAPPFVPVGPVLGGVGNGAPGCLC
ncbi:MAG: hypothetical protein OEZ43_14795 [Gammaproteobacteria bacterium]|nr:hypothetical protein [Gammaproteobacteria bacterium]